MFFSEEKNQKTFVCLSVVVATVCQILHMKTDKSFLLLFFKKEAFLA